VLEAEDATMVTVLALAERFSCSKRLTPRSLCAQAPAQDMNKTKSNAQLCKIRPHTRIPVPSRNIQDLGFLMVSEVAGCLCFHRLRIAE
jgi:hypothetical protein